MKLSNSVVSITELNTSLADYGIEAHIFRGVGEQQEVIGNGSLCFERGVSGVGVHCSDILIEQNASSSTQRSACFTVKEVFRITAWAASSSSSVTAWWTLARTAQINSSISWVTPNCAINDSASARIVWPNS